MNTDEGIEIKEAKDRRLTKSRKLETAKRKNALRNFVFSYLRVFVIFMLQGERSSSRLRGWSRSAGPFLAVVAIVLPGCAAKRPPELPKPVGPIRVLAVLDIEPGVPGPTAEEAKAPPRVPPEAGRAVTGQIYGVLANRRDFRFVPDLAVADVTRDPAVRGAASLIDRARALSKAVTTDAVLFGTVSRFDERVGTRYGATSPASVAFDLALLETATGEIIWRGQFAETQEPLTSNVLQIWMFWRGGPRWLTARELTRLGVERLFNDMRKAVRS
jgi:hypothetical protein